MIVSDGEIEGELQDRVATAIRSDPRFADQFVELEALAAEAQTTDLWEGLDRQREFDRLLEAGHWNDPAEILNPKGSDLYEVNYRRLIAVAEARLARNDDAEPIRRTLERLLRAELAAASKAVYLIAEAVKNLSKTTSERVLIEALDKRN